MAVAAVRHYQMRKQHDYFFLSSPMFFPSFLKKFMFTLIGSIMKVMIHILDTAFRVLGDLFVGYPVDFDFVCSIILT